MTRPSIRFDDWKLAIGAARDIDQVMRVVREYLAAWQLEELQSLPPDIASTSVERPEDVIARALLARRAELTAMAGADTRLLCEMALTLCAAATRLRHMTANNAFFARETA